SHLREAYNTTPYHLQGATSKRHITQHCITCREPPERGGYHNTVSHAGSHLREEDYTTPHHMQGATSERWIPQHRITCREPPQRGGYHNTASLAGSHLREAYNTTPHHMQGATSESWITQHVHPDYDGAQTGQAARTELDGAYDNISQGNRLSRG
ncbi:hypothetical protein MAR_011180, partial [Mya arenaria]